MDGGSHHTPKLLYHIQYVKTATDRNLIHELFIELIYSLTCLDNIRKVVS